MAERTSSGQPLRAAVIGSGFGGIAAAIRLQAAGVQTTILEAHDQPGGRARVFRDQGFTFDAGPTVITASTFNSRSVVATLSTGNWTMLILPGSLAFFSSSVLRTATSSDGMPYCATMTRKSSMLACERPTMPTRLPMSCSIFSMRGE